jgi:hypothetical protein
VLDSNFVLDDQGGIIIINYYDNLIIIGMANVRDHNFILLPCTPFFTASLHLFFNLLSCGK